MSGKKYGKEEIGGCCGKCLSCLMCCNLPASAGVKLVSVFSILLGLVYCCLGVWTLIVTSKNDELRQRDQMYYEVWADSEGVEGAEGILVAAQKKRVPLNAHYSYLIALACVSLAVGFTRTLSSIFLLWNSVEKHSILPGKLWMVLTFCGTTTVVTYMLVALNVTGFIADVPWSPVKVINDKYSFYILLSIFRLICLGDIFLAIYFIFIVHWFVRTR